MSNTVANIKKYQHENNFIEKNITTKTILDLICYIDKESSTAKSQKLTAKSQRQKNIWWFGLQTRFIAAGGVTKTSPAHPKDSVRN